jgi:DNA-binding transcriptional MerR regulator/methylmalonyl-CoA mutase cobalamin-binding subunit
MYTIKQAAIRSGVSVPLIRAWERRYGIVSPRRTASGYRMYDDDAIATLVRVRELTESGWSASEASRAILAGEVTLLAAPRPVPVPVDQQHHDSQIQRFVEAAIDTDVVRTGAVLDEIFAQGSYESVIDDVLMPAVVALGKAWWDGRLDIAAEHAATAALLRRLSALYEAAAAPGEARAVVGLPPGARHELGALAFAVALRRIGVGVLYLGADVPVSSWVRVMRQSRRRLAVIGIVTREDQPAALEVVRALRIESPDTVVAVGGQWADWDEGEEAGVIVLPGRIAEAAVVAARLANGGPADERPRE